MSVSRVENEYIDLSIDKSLSSVENVCCNADSSAAEESALSVTCRVRILYRFLDIFYSDESL